MNTTIRNALLLAAGSGALVAARAGLRRRRRLTLRDKVVLITGGARGLGLVMARQFADEGARLVICSRDDDQLERARDELAGRGAEVFAVPCDVTDQGQVNYLVQHAVDRFGGVDVLVNNAGVIEVGPMEVMTLEDFDRAMRTHFWGPLYMMLAVLPGMRERRLGRIVNISSIGGRIGIPHLAPYSASKFALAGLSEALRAELRKDNIYLTLVCPGLMRTGSPVNATFKGKHKAEYAWFSIGDALPVTSMEAERAARQIVDACKRGDAEAILSIQAKVAVLFHTLMPEVIADVSGAVNMLLPGPGGIGTASAKGKDSRPDNLPEWLTALSDAAAERNNELT